MTTGHALVTGACSGIGLEIARELARRGHPLILVSDRGVELDTAARQISTDHQVGTHSITIDLAQPDAARELHEKVQQKGLTVDILVSNAGMFFFGEVADSDPARANAMLQLHVVTPSLLARYFAPDMKVRGRGHILLVSSISAWGDFPGIAWYGSSKRYLRSFAASLRDELHVWGVKVTCLAPGAVATGLYAQTGVPVQTAVKYRVMAHPERIAKIAVRGMLRGKAVIIPGLSAKVMARAMALAPHCLIRSIRERTSLLPGPRCDLEEGQDGASELDRTPEG